ncbi:MAG TPA: HIT family protein [Candidatus Obscuribacterales bacterium]
MSSENCPICRRQKSTDLDSVVFESENWIVRHSPETNILGYLLVEAKRHYLDLSEATAAEASTFGPVCKEMAAAIRKITRAERVYSFSLNEAVPHFHTHLIPRTAAIPRRYRARGILAYPLEPTADRTLVAETCSRLRSCLRRLPGLQAISNV